MDYQSNIWKLYAIRFFRSLIPAYVIERLFWEQRGMTIQMVVYTEIVYAMTIMFLEVPLGVLADKWKRKYLIGMAAILEGSMFLILIFSTEFWHFAFAIFLSGISGAAKSGAESALLYDSLLLKKKEQYFEKYLGRLNAIASTAAILAALCGSFLANRFSFELNYWLSVGSMLASTSFVLFLAEPHIKSHSQEAIPIKDYLLSAINFFKSNRSAAIVVFFGMIAGAAIGFIWEFWQIYLERLDIPIVYFGIFSTLFMLFSLPGNLLAHYLKRRFQYRQILIFVISVLTVGLLYLSLVKNITAIVVLLIIFLITGVMEPLVSGYMHHRIKDSSIRATIDSFQSLAFNGLLIVVGIGFGYFSSHFDIFGGFGFMAFISGAFLLWFWFTTKKTAV